MSTDSNTTPSQGTNSIRTPIFNFLVPLGLPPFCFSDQYDFTHCVHHPLCIHTDAQTEEFRKVLAGKKILVTGGTGYIGSHTVVELIHVGAEVYIVDK